MSMEEKIRSKKKIGNKIKNANIVELALATGIHLGVSQPQQFLVQVAQ